MEGKHHCLRAMYTNHFITARQRCTSYRILSDRLSDHSTVCHSLVSRQNDSS